MEPESKEYDKKRFIHSLIFPAFFVFVVIMVKIVDPGFALAFPHLGIYPLKAKGLKGILLSPMVHADYKHLVDNCIPLFLLGVAVFYFYHTCVEKRGVLNYLMVGLWELLQI